MAENWHRLLESQGECLRLLHGMLGACPKRGGEVGSFEDEALVTRAERSDPGSEGAGRHGLIAVSDRQMNGEGASLTEHALGS